MKKLILSVGIVGAVSAMTSASYAQAEINFNNVLDTTVAVGGNVHSGDYSPADDKFLVGTINLDIKVINGTTGAAEADKDITGITPGGLGFFALAIGEDGSIFTWEAGAANLWQWDNVADTSPTLAGASVAFARTGQVLGSGNNTKVYLTGASNAGPVHIYSTADDASYTLLESVAASSKSALAVNAAGDALWAIPDSNQNIVKTVNTGTWGAAVGWAPGTNGAGAASLAYDDANNVLFAVVGTNLHALDGTDGTPLTGSPFTLTNGLNSIPGYSGSHVSSTAGSGTLWFVGRGTTASDASIHKLTYTVTANDVNDWSMY